MGYSTGLRPLARGSFPSRRSRAARRAAQKGLPSFSTGRNHFMEHSLYPVPPRFTVRRLVLMDLAAICTLYGACGRDTAWGTRETLAALFGEGEWWGGFLVGG